MYFMVKVLTSLELSAVVAELQQLAGVKVSKIHQPSSRVLILNLFKTGGQKFLLKIDSGVGMYVTSYTQKNPLTPLGFCLFLRKHLNGSKLLEVNQKNLERIVEFHFDTRAGLRILVCELFSKGNFVLCDGSYKIINCASVQTWKDRTIKRGETYKYPPEGFNLLTLNQQLFQEYLAEHSEYEIVKLLATLGFGGTYAEELCIRAKVQKTTISQMLKPDEISRLFTEASTLISAFSSNSAELIYDDGQPINATPFHLKFYEDNEQKSVASFNSALDVLYTSKVTQEVKKKSDASYQQEKQRLDAIYESQKQSIEAYEEEYRQNQKIAEQIYNQYQTIATIFSKIKQAVDSGHDWYEVYQVLQREKDAGIYEANLVREIKPETRQIIIAVEPELALDLTKSLEQNAGDYYEKAKKSKSKIEGAQRTLDGVKQKMAQLDSRRESMQKSYAVAEPKLIEKKKLAWYEKFHWFITSSGLLAVGGRDATTNEILVKKHMEIKDFVFHTEIAGSPFFILKDARDKAKDQDLQEVAQATATYSSAWKLGAGTIDVYQIKPEQVTKQANPGEYLGKGSFMIRGKKNYFRNTVLELAIGADETGKLMAGPVSAIKKHFTKYKVIRQGDLKKSDIAKSIAKDFSVSVDEVMGLVPTGESKVISIGNC
jgi:predicted ribosome quality control (RQC) complex YloA/Tae2 family protein